MMRIKWFGKHFIYIFVIHILAGNGCSSTQTLVAGDDSRILSSPNFPDLYPK